MTVDMPSVVPPKPEFQVPRSPHWETAERHHLLKQPRCLVSGSDVGLQVHHKFPFHFVVMLGRPDLETDERNLFTLNRDYHLIVGHLDDWESYNPELEGFIAVCRGLLVSQIKAMPAYLDRKARRPKHLHNMTDADKRGFVADLNHLFPKG